MGQKGREIVNMDVDELINLLNRALSDEWLAYYQYWIGSKVVKGPMKDAVIAELTVHATEELAHAELISARIISKLSDSSIDRALLAFSAHSTR